MIAYQILCKNRKRKIGKNRQLLEDQLEEATKLSIVREYAKINSRR
jgi:hypothetical protein